MSKPWMGLLAWGLAACGNGATRTDASTVDVAMDAALPCTPGSSVACTCPGGASGRETCGTSGRFGECDCRDSGPTDAPDAAVDCDAGEACNGVCVDTQSDRDNCGACGSVCESTMHARSTCVGGRCESSCDAGFTPQGTECVAGYAAPRPIAPLSTQSVHAQRPTFHWALPAATPVTGAHVDLCRDHACTTVAQSFDATGDHGSPSTALTPGVWFWRVTGTVAGAVSTPPSPVWEFTVPAHGAAVANAYGNLLDVDADGFADVLIDGDTAGTRVYRGSAAGVATTPVVTLAIVDESTILDSASIGDVNGDGFDDIGRLQDHTADRTRQVLVHFGSATGVPSSASQTLEADQVTGCDGGGQSVLGAAGDVNGDGYADVFVEIPDVCLAVTNQSCLVVYYGSATGLDASHSDAFCGGTDVGQQWPANAASAGDVNGDGYADLAVVVPGGVDVVMGSATGLSSVPVAVSVAGGGMAVRVGTAGDFDGDGYTDVPLGAAGTQTFAVLRGSASGVGTTAGAIVTMPGAVDFGSDVTAVDDVDGDGFDDAVVTAPMSHAVFAFHGSASGLASAPWITLHGPTIERFGYAVAGAGDVDGDTFADVLVGSPSDSTPATGRADLYRGGASGLVDAATTTWMGSGPGFGGRVR